MMLNVRHSLDALVVDLLPTPKVSAPPRGAPWTKRKRQLGLEEQARATAEAAYKRGAKFVDVAYFDPYVKRVRIENADPDTLGFVPQWYGERVLEHPDQNG